MWWGGERFCYLEQQESPKKRVLWINQRALGGLGAAFGDQKWSDSERGDFGALGRRVRNWDGKKTEQSGR